MGEELGRGGRRGCAPEWQRVARSRGGGSCLAGAAQDPVTGAEGRAGGGEVGGGRGGAEVTGRWKGGARSHEEGGGASAVPRKKKGGTCFFFQE